MITGDHPATALAIARNLGIVTETDIAQGTYGPVLTGQELAKLSVDEFESRVERSGFMLVFHLSRKLISLKRFKIRVSLLL